MMTDLETLLQQLDRGMEVRLTLVLTPDGSPPLLNRWLANRAMPWARRRLTRADNAPAHFLANLAAALRPLVPDLTPRPLSPEIDVLDVTGELLNALLAVEEDFALILEAYHTITASDVHAAVTLMADYPPPRLHLYLVSKSRPPLPLPRLRVRQQLVEIDLR
jgi:LuxR family maltose regulon positive regulatory protein